ncbi:hypothetical protein B566_EDAN001023 [Ephemera danica]|nr:hypothetical protein B566_EDAN001023 [Ephemera danica]
MEPIAHLVKVSVPNYLSNLPLPDSVGGWFHLGFKDWAKLVPFGAAVAGFTYMTYRAFCPAAQCKGKLINPDIQKNSAKVVHSVDIEDIGDHAAFCRCWRSRKVSIITIRLQ